MSRAQIGARSAQSPDEFGRAAQVGARRAEGCAAGKTVRVGRDRARRRGARSEECDD